jgi:hypothetical protein
MYQSHFSTLTGLGFNFEATQIHLCKLSAKFRDYRSTKRTIAGSAPFSVAGQRADQRRVTMFYLEVPDNCTNRNFTPAKLVRLLVAELSVFLTGSIIMGVSYPVANHDTR